MPRIGTLGTQVEQESHSYNPVYADTNGNLYTITESILSANNQPRAMKSTDDGATWAEQDAANRPGTDTGGIGDLESGWITQEPGYLTFTWARSNPVYSRFRTSDHPTNPDTWEDNDREAVGSGEGTPQFMSHTSPTDQTYQWMFWGNGTGISYCNRPLGADTTESSTLTLQASAGAPTSWLDGDDVSWVLYKSGSQLHYKTLTSAGTLSGATRVDTNGVNAVAIPHTRPVPYSSGADDIVTCLFANGSGQLRAVDIVNGTPGSEQTVTNSAVMLDPADTGNAGAVISADVDGTTVHAVWSDASTGDVMHSERPHGGSWSTPDVVEGSLVTGAYYVYAKVIDYGNKVLAIRYSDGFDSVGEVNDIFYTEVALAVAGVGSATGTHQWAGTASGVRRLVSDWSGVESATTFADVNSGTVTGTHAWAGTANGARPSEGSVTGTHAWSGVATGEHVAKGSTTGTHSWSGTATGARLSEGSASGTHAWAGTATGSAPTVGVNSGSATGTHAWAGSATGSHVAEGSASGTHAWAGAASGSAPSVGVNNGSATGTHQWAGVATGSHVSAGSATGTHEWDGAAVGERRPAGDATGTHEWAGSASGARASQGAVAGTHAWAGSASGSAPVVGASNGSATGTHAWAGTATGARASAGTSTGTHEWAGTATGSAPAVGVNSGSASGTHAWSGVASGARSSRGTASGTHQWAGNSSGDVPPNAGSSTGTHAWSGTATGARASAGSATGTHQWAGTASGSAPEVGESNGQAVGTHSWAGTATGARASRGSAAATHVWSGVSSGERHPKGSSTGTHSWAGTATGSTPAVAGNSGTASGTHQWAGSATGHRGRHVGSAAGTHSWSGVVDGSRASRGTVAGTHVWTAAATGSHTARGSATGTHTWDGEAQGIAGQSFHRVRGGQAALVAPVAVQASTVNPYVARASLGTSTTNADLDE